MKIVKIILLAIWVVCTSLFLIGVLTPLSFTNKFFLYSTFFIAFNGIFALSYLLTSFITLKPNTVLLALIASIALLLTYEFYPRFGSGWKTKEILYRQKDNSENIIAFQIHDMGAFGSDHRTIKVIKVTPLYNWITELKKVEANEEWIKTNQQVGNPE